MTDEKRLDARLENQSARRSRAARIGGIALAIAYCAVVVAAGWFVRPLDWRALGGVAVFPAAVAFLAGIPMVVRCRPRRTPILFHLIVYPIVAAVTMGIPGAILAYLVSTEAGS